MNGPPSVTTLKLAPLASTEEIMPRRPTALPLVLFVGWATMGTGVRLKVGVMVNEFVIFGFGAWLQEPGVQLADCETSKSSESPIAVPVMVMGAGKFTVTCEGSVYP